MELIANEGRRGLIRERLLPLNCRQTGLFNADTEQDLVCFRRLLFPEPLEVPAVASMSMIDIC